MKVSRPPVFGGLLSAAMLLGLLAPAFAQYYRPTVPNQSAAQRRWPQPSLLPPRQQPLRVAERPQPAASQSTTTQATSSLEIAPAQSGEHPLVPVLRWAADGLVNIEKVEDYSATVVKRERLGDTVGGYEYMFVKIRQRPLSVYTYFLGPPDLKGQECIYIEGQNDGKMWAHGTGLQQKMFGTVLIAPDGMIAMRGQRYPLTEIGLLNLVRRLIEVGEQDTKYGECEVKTFKNAKINNRVCTCIQVIHPVPRRNFRFHLARIFVDDELNVPVRYEAYDWPKEQGGAPQLIEEYTYLDLKLNQGFTDADFDTKNPNYSF